MFFKSSTKAKGFTLVEMVLVIIILGVLAGATTQFIGLGTQIFVETSGRDQLISSARFAVERLNREVRNALPNSLRVNNSANNSCLEFVPIVASTTYLDIPVSPEPDDDEIEFVPFDNPNEVNDLKVAVYPLSEADVYGANNKVKLLAGAVTQNPSNKWTATLDGGDTNFAADSPTRRIYFIDSAVSFCIDNVGEQKLYRHQNYNYDAGNMPDNNGVLMAENLQLNINVVDATLQRNSMVILELTFNNYNETIVFNNEIQVPNVP